MANESTVEVVLGDLADLADLVASKTGHGTAGAVAQVAGLVFRSAEGVAHVVSAAEVERIRQAAALGEAAGRSAYEASRQNFKKAP